jgi:hypothetical protein
MAEPGPKGRISSMNLLPTEEEEAVVNALAKFFA